LGGRRITFINILEGVAGVLGEKFIVAVSFFWILWPQNKQYCGFIKTLNTW
jgi:hypothetical protein